MGSLTLGLMAFPTNPAWLSPLPPVQAPVIRWLLRNGGWQPASGSTTRRSRRPGSTALLPDSRIDHVGYASEGQEMTGHWPQDHFLSDLQEFDG